MPITAYFCVVSPMFLVYIENDFDIYLGMILPTHLANKDKMPISVRMSSLILNKNVATSRKSCPYSL